jgi:hypothetical protein
MMLYNKLMVLNDKFFDFINGLDEEFEQIKLATNKIALNPECNLKEAYRVLREYSEQVFTTLRIKKDEISINKFAISQKLSNLSNINMAASNSELANQLKNFTQKSSSLFESAFADSVNKHLRPEIGDLWLVSKELVNQLTEEDFIESHRSNEIQLTINDKTIDSILSSIRKNLEKIAENDIGFLNECLSNIQNEVQKQFENNSVEGFRRLIKNFEFPVKYDEILTSSVRIESPFQGSCPKIDFRSMIIEMRSYSIMFILLVSTFGLNKSKNETLINAIYVTSLILIVIGAFATYAKIKDSKTDKKADELKKAREKISNEIKRGITEFISEWRSLVLAGFKTAMSEIVAEVERTIKEDLTSRMDKLTKEKTELTKVYAEIDMAEKKYQEAFRKSENLKSQIDLYKHEIIISK